MVYCVAAGDHWGVEHSGGWWLSAAAVAAVMSDRFGYAVVSGVITLGFAVAIGLAVLSWWVWGLPL